MSDDERAVLGDELQQRGDPQGELIALQLALEAAPPGARRNVLERKIAALLDREHDALYGSLAPFVDRLSRPDRLDPVLLVKKWRGGFADTIWIQRALTGMDHAQAIREMRALSIARFVRRIEIGHGDHPAALAELVREPMPSLRELVVGDNSHNVPGMGVYTLPDTRVLDPIVGQLELLEIRHATKVFALDAPVMRKLHLYVSRDPVPPRVFDLATPALEELSCIGFQIDRTFVDRYPKLRRLELHTSLEPGWFEHFVRSEMLARLETLMISRLGDADLRVIAQYANRFAKMKRLDLSYNYFTPDVREEVAAELPACVRYR